MPPRRPPPLLPKARLLEAINATPVDNRTTPKEVYDSRIVLSDGNASTAPSLPKPWHAAPDKEDSADLSKPAGYPVIPVTGCTYYSQSLPAISNPETATIHTSFICTSEPNDASTDNNDTSTKARGIPSNETEPRFLGRAQTTRDVEAMQSGSEDSPSGPVSRQVMLLELAQGTSKTVETNSLSHIPELLQSKGLTLAKGSGSPPVIVLGNMGYPDLQAIFDGKRGILEAYEKTLSELAFCPNVYWQFSGYLSLLPSEKVATAFQEVSSGSPNGGEAYKACKKAVSAFFAPVLEAFGEDRIIWGSDWPRYSSAIATSTKNSAQDEWRFARKLALDVVCEIGLRGESLDKIFHSNASALVVKAS